MFGCLSFKHCFLLVYVRWVHVTILFHVNMVHHNILLHITFCYKTDVTRNCLALYLLPTIKRHYVVDEPRGKQVPRKSRRIPKSNVSSLSFPVKSTEQCPTIQLDREKGTLTEYILIAASIIDRVVE